MTGAIRKGNTLKIDKKTLKRAGIFALIIALAIISVLLIEYLIGERGDEIDYNKYRDEMIRELEDNVGEYDESVIVLDQTTQPYAEQMAEALSATLRITSNGHFATLTLPEGVTILDVCKNDEYLYELPRMSIDYKATVSEITHVDWEGEGDMRKPLAPQYTVTDGSYVLQGYLDYLNMKNAWEYTRGQGITVAVIDTGIDTDHPEFEGKISEYSYNATLDKIVKDYTLPDGSYDWSLIEDEQGHGTSVAGVIASSMNNGGIVGIAPEVELLVIKAKCNEKGEFENSSDLVFGLYYAIERDASVVNMSFGSYGNNPYAAAAQLAKDSDIICVAAAGNDETADPCFPAADENVIGVGALAADSWELAEYSNYGENVDIVAPGTTYTTKNGGGYGLSNGTSLASPIVSGAVALYLTQYEFSELIDVRDALYASSYDLGDIGEDWYYGFGALDINAFIFEERGTVTFNMMSDELENLEGLFIRNHTLQSIPEPERLYAVFDGWYYDPQFTEEYNWYADVFSSDLTLYAKWVNEEDGIPFTYVELPDGTIEIRSYTGHRKYITVPDYIEGKKVTSIGRGAFENEQGIRQVVLPKYLVTIKDLAFAGCSNLLNIKIPDGVTSIGSYAFSSNVRLSSFELSSNSKLEKIGGFAFENCSKLRNFTIPSKLSSVDGSAFVGATSLMSFDIQSGNTYFKVLDGVLYKQGMDEAVAYPAGRKGEYELPEGVSVIGDYAFAYARITEIDLSGVHTVGQYGFTNTWLEELTIPDEVITAGKGAFSSTVYLKKVTIGRGLAELSDELFFNSGIESITIPANIEKIGGSVFYISSLSSVVFEKDSKLAEIGVRAFCGTPITEITLPKSLEIIGKYAFSACFGLQRVEFKEGCGLLVIDDYAFEQTFRLTEIKLPSKLMTIGEFAFCKSGLKEITIPASVKEIKMAAFGSCRSLTDIYVESESQSYTDVDGVAYTKDKTVLVAYPAGNTREEYRVLDGTVAIGEGAFYGTYGLLSVSLPDSLEEIREFAFYENISLESMHIPDNVVQIGRYSFGYDLSLRSVTFNKTSKLPRISYAAFANCGLESFTVPASVSTMAQGAFLGCEKLFHFVFAENSKLQSISAYMFSGCDNLISITFEKGSALTSIQAHGLEGMRKLQSIDFGDAKLTNIDNFAFRFCESLQSFEIPEGVTYIGRYAFYYCTSLEEITIPESVEFIGRFFALGASRANLYFKSEALPRVLEEDWDYGLGGYYVGVTDVIESGGWQYAILSDGGIGIIKYKGNEKTVDITKLKLGGEIVNIGGGAFRNSAAEVVILPESVKIIQAEAFYGSALKEIVIPKEVSFIGREAFADSSLERITFTIGSKLEVIERSAFENTKKLTKITLPASLKEMGRAVFNNSGLTEVVFEEGIVLTEIPENAFSYTALKSVALPKGITLINHNAFRNTESLEYVSFGDADFMVMSNAFYESGLRDLTIPKNMTYIGEYAFVALKNLTEFKVDENNEYYKAVDGLLLGNRERKLIAVPAGRKGDLSVPISVEEIGFGAFESSKLSNVYFDENANVLSFGYRAFYNAQGIKEITIPASVVSIDYYAFAMCRNLEKVTFAEGNQLSGVYEGAFYGCEKLYDITLPDAIVEISDFAFYGCRKLDRIPITENSEIKGIYDYAMAYTGIKGELTTPAALADIGSYAFSGNKITKLTIPSDNAWDLIIGIGAFENCNMLTEVTLPFIGASFEDLELSWFSYIFGAGRPEASDAYIPDSLERVTICEGISLVASGSFVEVNSLVYVELPRSVTSLYPRAFHTEYVGSQHGVSFEFRSPIAFVDYNGKQVSSVGPEYLQDTHIMGTLEIAEGTEVIEDLAFYGCSGLSGIIIPEGVTYIGMHGFDGANASVITLPSTLEFIGEYAFQAARFDKIINHSSLDIQLGSNAHGQIAEMANLIVHKDGSIEYRDGIDAEVHIETTDGFVFTRDNGQYYLNYYVGREDTVTLPAEIFGQKYVIAWMGGAENIIIPGELSDVNDGAFGYYGSGSGVRSIVVEEGITRIGDRAFGDLYNLVSIKLPSTLVEIGSSAFAWCHRLERIELPSGLKSIGGAAFANCMKLKEIYIPENVETIGTGAFNGCPKLTVKVSRRNTSFTIIDGVLYDKQVSRILYVPNDMIEIVIPKTVSDLSEAFKEHKSLSKVSFEKGTRISEIGREAFQYCRELREIEIPESVTVIGQSAFGGCISLVEITLPDGLTKLRDNAFSNCDSLNGIIIPEGVEYIGDGAFYGCRSLTEIKLPEKLTEIAYGTFDECTALNKVNIPDSVVMIGERAFAHCPILELQMDGDHPAFTLVDGVVYNKDITEAVFTTALARRVVIPNTVKKLNLAFIGSYVLEIDFEENSQITEFKTNEFYDCSQLNKLTIPESVVKIDEYAYGGERLYYIINNSDVELEVEPENYKLITQAAKVLVEKNGTRKYAPDGRYYYHDVSFEGFDYIDTADGFRYAYCDGMYFLISYIGGSDEVTLPTSINGKSFETWFLSGVKKLIISEGVTELTMNQFSHNPLLSEVSLPTTLKVIGNGTFDTTGITNIEIPQGVETISGYAFAACFNLRSIEIPSSVKTLAPWVFSNCVSLEKVVLNDGIEHIGEDAFAYTKYYNTEQNWTNGSLYIGNYLIEADENAVVFEIPDNILASAADAFEKCFNIKEISVGDTVCYLKHLTNLETLIIREMPEDPIIRNYFYDYETGGLLVPITLKNIVLSEDVRMKENAFYMIEGVNIFVDQLMKDTMWDENFPHWNNGNRAVYSDRWINAYFYDSDNTLIQKNIFLTSQVITQPWVGEYTDGIYTYLLSGYDIDRDGVADFIPATSTEDVSATAVYERYETCALLGHTESEWLTESAATCTEGGVEYKECIVCMERLESKETEATGHAESEWIEDPAAHLMYTQCEVCFVRMNQKQIEDQGGNGGGNNGGQSQKPSESQKPSQSDKPNDDPNGDNGDAPPTNNKKGCRSSSKGDLLSLLVTSPLTLLWFVFKKIFG